MPYYTRHLREILDEIGIPDVKAYQVRVDQFVQEIIGTRDLDSDEVWAILQPRLKEESWRRDFIEQLRLKWEQRDWRKEGL